jgi:hypothetical protein
MPHFHISEHYYEKRYKIIGSAPKYAGERIWKNKWFNVKTGAADRRASTGFQQRRATLGSGKPVFD